mmetsp:Transcript_30500/g.51412  ORF Transcript_30500/g.51412 Transcript_30500/m.51412 type:complete len:175 (-) Transcript_30500:151-675(-)
MFSPAGRRWLSACLLLLQLSSLAQASGRGIENRLNSHRIAYLALELIENRCPSMGPKYLRSTIKQHVGILDAADLKVGFIDLNAKDIDVSATMQKLKEGTQMLLDGKIVGRRLLGNPQIEAADRASVTLMQSKKKLACSEASKIVEEFCYGAIDDHGYEFVEAWFMGVGCIEAP